MCCMRPSNILILILNSCQFKLYPVWYFVLRLGKLIEHCCEMFEEHVISMHIQNLFGHFVNFLHEYILKISLKFVVNGI
jgi:lantibiotic modifying enzyme